jgi:hypothetical protein
MLVALDLVLMLCLVKDWFKVLSTHLINANLLNLLYFPLAIFIASLSFLNVVLKGLEQETFNG